MSYGSNVGEPGADFGGCTVFGHPNTGIMGQHLIHGIDGGLKYGWSPLLNSCEKEPRLCHPLVSIKKKTCGVRKEYSCPSI
jgi:hypothetical protein